MSYRRACCSKENIRPIYMSNSFHATSHKRLPSSPIAANPPCTKKILISSSKKVPSRIPKAANIKRAISTPSISLNTRAVVPKLPKPDGNSKKYPCYNCKCCESIKHMQPFLMAIYERQKYISKLLSNANIGKTMTSTPKRGYKKNCLDVKRRHC